MADHDGRSTSETQRLAAELLERPAEGRALQLSRLEELRHVLRETSEQDLLLHRKTLETIASMRRELERMKRILSRLATARAR